MVSIPERIPQIASPQSASPRALRPERFAQSASPRALRPERFAERFATHVDHFDIFRVSNFFQKSFLPMETFSLVFTK
jgi:hypothetical protein